MSYIIIIGAKSDIAKAVAMQYAKAGFNLYLAARSAQELEVYARHIEIKTQNTVHLVELDILDFNSHKDFYNSLIEKPIGVISAVGYLGSQQEAEIDSNEFNKIINTNFFVLANLLNIISNDFEERKSGFIVGISSVAGDKGKKSNYVYGAAKS